LGGLGSGRWRGHKRKRQVESCLALDIRDLKRLGILSSPSAVVGQLSWKASPNGTLLGSATFCLGPLHTDERGLLLRLGEELDPACDLQLFKLQWVPIGAAPRWLLLCPECGEQRAHP
jgi:hypothetical protein